MQAKVPHQVTLDALSALQGLSQCHYSVVACGKRPHQCSSWSRCASSFFASASWNIWSEGLCSKTPRHPTGPKHVTCWHDYF